MAVEFWTLQESFPPVISTHVDGQDWRKGMAVLFVAFDCRAQNLETIRMFPRYWLQISVKRHITQKSILHFLLILDFIWLSGHHQGHYNNSKLRILYCGF